MSNSLRIDALVYTKGISNVWFIKKTWPGKLILLRFQKFKNLNSFPILCTEFVKKWGNYSRGDIIQWRILIKEIQYVFTCSFLMLWWTHFPCKLTNYFIENDSVNFQFKSSFCYFDSDLSQVSQKIIERNHLAQKYIYAKPTTVTRIFPIGQWSLLYSND